MSEHAHGTFDVTVTPQPSDDGIGRFELTKAWSGISPAPATGSCSRG